MIWMTDFQNFNQPSKQFKPDTTRYQILHTLIWSWKSSIHDIIPPINIIKPIQYIFLPTSYIKKRNEIHLLLNLFYFNLPALCFLGAFLLIKMSGVFWQVKGYVKCPHLGTGPVINSCRYIYLKFPNRTDKETKIMGCSHFARNHVPVSNRTDQLTDILQTYT